MNTASLAKAITATPATTPAIVPQEAVRRLPRWALLLLSVAYILAGFIGREPWKSADMASFGLMREIALGRSDWLSPSFLGEAPAMMALLPYWLGAGFIQINSALGGWLPMDVAARVPFALLLALTLASTWYAVYYLARLPAAQPVPFAFGGEAEPVSYARSLADGSLLALLAMLGLAQLSHETTPTLAQLAFSALLFYAVAASTIGRVMPAIALVLASFGLALSGSPAFGLALCLAAALVRAVQRDTQRWYWATGIAACGLVAAWSAISLGQWHANWGSWPSGRGWWNLGKLWVWFTWPAWPLALVALWRWRRWWRSAHIAWPAAVLLVMVVATIVRPGADRTLLLATPAFACLAAMALPTLHRSVSALVDWFTILFFAGCGIVIWVIYISMHVGIPAKPAANVRRLLPGFEPSFSSVALLAALVATVGWVAVIVWRTGRHRSALWKSLVIPASGAVTCWILLTTLWMPMLDYARSYAPMAQRVRLAVGESACVHGLKLAHAQAAALQYHGRYAVLPLRDETLELPRCDWLIMDSDLFKLKDFSMPPGWQLIQSVRRRTSNDAETLLIYKRVRL
jgi:4-amino-4-deoxy-L-arabinose transferase-like glycosyltransferase